MSPGRDQDHLCEGIGLLERTFAQGLGNRDWIENDPDYDSIRDEPRFQALLKQPR